MSVFISYRRDGGSQVAQEIYQSLHDEYDIFLDTESLANGYFDEAIVKRIAESTDFILLIAETTFDRCHEPNDWITNEVQIALLENKNIIPIFIGIEGFPDNIPKQFENLRRYNGLFWSNRYLTINRLRDFLSSNKRHIISIVRENQNIKLSEKTKQELLALYTRFHSQGRKSVDIQLEINDFNDLSKIFLSDMLSHGLSDVVAATEAEQTLKRNFYWYKKTLEIAIEQLLQDDMIDICAMKNSSDYVNRYGVKHCRGFDENGVEVYYWTPFAWFEIIEELLKELVGSRLNKYRNIKTNLPIQCYAVTQNGKIIWHFPSVIPKIIVEGIPPLPNPDPTGDRNPNCYDIPPKELLYYVYPDFYYNIALIKQGKHDVKLEDIEKINGIINLYYYRFGIS